MSKEKGPGDGAFFLCINDVDTNSPKLGFEDILHYQQIIVALTETSRLMGEIDKIEIE
jgi:hypothetical protein